MNVKAFENVKDQIGYCGIWCGSCVVGNGVLRELTRIFRDVVEGYGLEGWVSKDFDFNEFSKGLASIQATPICPGCRKGGGAAGCEMRACASERGLNDCLECGMPRTCEHWDRLHRMRAGALGAGLMVKNEVTYPRDLIEKWTMELKSKRPSNLLFSGDQ
jgi:hypothetical protein